ncbi:TetR/AcrR family transcriptional regulator [Streptomyces sp. NPDC018031]|uniref:TetR/AcrR family transcriptional regulator n=1 Tax=Streptomyces sp. NPDC018031 TaxID=3365033 RepID=UPI0037A6E9E3
MSSEQKSADGPRAGARPPGRPPRLELATIVGAARHILETEGPAGLSMRRLAKEVGSTPMALYRHVRDKDELMLLAVDGLAATVPRPELPADPRERVHVTALHMHDVLWEMPWVVDIISLGELTDRHALWMVEEIVDSAMACGLGESDAVHAYRSIWHFVLGTLVFRSAMARRARQPDRPRYFMEMLREADPAEMPRLAALSDRWPEVLDGYDVARELRAVVDGLLDRRPAR